MKTGAPMIKMSTTRVILALSTALILWGCSEDFTLLSPISERNVESFYRNETDFTVAINGAYSTLAGNGAYNRSYVLLHEMRSDNTMNGGGATGLAEVYFRLAHFTEQATQDELSTPWTTAYQGIARTNVILDRLDNLPDGDFKERIRGEALFIRSLFYYHLAVLWGNVPLQLEAVTSPDVEVNQVPASVIYEQIISDLELAQAALPASYDAEDVGRATSGAANALLGLVYLTNGQRGLAETALRRVVNSGQYQLVDHYADLWGVANENNVESVFELQYKEGGTGTGSQFTDYYTPFGGSGGVGAGNAPQVLSPDIEYIHDLQYGIEETDERGWGGTWDFAVNEDGDTTNVWIRKWNSIPFGPGDADNNFPVFRYADVLLMLAEALGESSEAYDLINQVRARAGVTPISAATPGTFAEKLLFERRLEFITEGKRWADLLRFGVAKQVMASFDPLVAAGLTEADIRTLYPIPQREIDVSPGEMVQNNY
jgi:hypothetical protein